MSVLLLFAIFGVSLGTNYASSQLSNATSYTTNLTSNLTHGSNLSAIDINAFGENNTQLSPGQILAPQDIRFEFSTSSKPISFLCSLFRVNEDLSGALTRTMVSSDTCGAKTLAGSNVYNQKNFAVNGSNQYEFNVRGTDVDNKPFGNATFPFNIIGTSSEEAAPETNVFSGNDIEQIITKDCSGAINVPDADRHLVQATYHIDGISDDFLNETVTSTSENPRDISITLTADQSGVQGGHLGWPLSIDFTPTKATIKCEFKNIDEVTKATTPGYPIEAGFFRPLFGRCTPEFGNVENHVDGVFTPGTTTFTGTRHYPVSVEYTINGEGSLLGNINLNYRSAAITLDPLTSSTSCSNLPPE